MHSIEPECPDEEIVVKDVSNTAAYAAEWTLGGMVFQLATVVGSPRLKIAYKPVGMKNWASCGDLADARMFGWTGPIRNTSELLAIAVRVVKEHSVNYFITLTGVSPN